MAYRAVFCHVCGSPVKWRDYVGPVCYKDYHPVTDPYVPPKPPPPNPQDGWPLVWTDDTVPLKG